MYLHKKPLSPSSVNANYNENDFPHYAGFTQDLAAALTTAGHYSDGVNEAVLRGLIAEYNGVRPENILITNGADAAIEFLLRQTPSVRLPTNTYKTYELFASRYGVSMQPPYATTIICNPNNPDGAIADPETIFGPAIVDETYMDYYENRHSCAHHVDTRDICIVRSFSKFFGLAGLRLGYIIASAPRIEEFNKTYFHKHINNVAVAAGILVLRHYPHYLDMSRRMESNRGRICRLLDSFGIVHTSGANFICAHVYGGFLEFMEARDIHFRDLADRGLAGHVRITVMDDPGTQRICDALTAYFSQPKIPLGLSDSPSKIVRVIVDMDNTIADYSSAFERRYESLYSTKTVMDDHLGKAMPLDFHHNGFYLELDPYPGAIDFLQRLIRRANADVVLCSHTEGAIEAADKCVWIQRHLGPFWVERFVPVNDPREKAAILGDIIIDDNIVEFVDYPQIVIKYKQSYNSGWFTWTVPNYQRLLAIIDAITWPELKQM